MVVIKNISGNTFKMFICIIGLRGKPRNRHRLRSPLTFFVRGILWFVWPWSHSQISSLSFQPTETHLQFIVYLSHLITPVIDLSSLSQTTSCWLFFPSPLLYLLWNLLSKLSVIEYKMNLVLRTFSILGILSCLSQYTHVHSFHNWMLPG